MGDAAQCLPRPRRRGDLGQGCTLAQRGVVGATVVGHTAHGVNARVPQQGVGDGGLGALPEHRLTHARHHQAPVASRHHVRELRQPRNQPNQANRVAGTYGNDDISRLQRCECRCVASRRLGVEHEFLVGLK